MTLVPPEGTTYVCPKCDGPITAISGPRLGWLMIFLRQVKVHPCHHRLDSDGMRQVLAQAKEQR